MISDLTSTFAWLNAHPGIFNGLQRGIEREALRINVHGHLAHSKHPQALGSTLTHRWITTDFAEALLEFITPVKSDPLQLLNFLCDLHGHSLRHLDSERFWPLSIPYWDNTDPYIALAHYGSSNLGRFKTLYRRGLQQRYGALTQCIAGIHYNFSLPLAFWQAYAEIDDAVSGKERISAAYFGLIRNYHRFGWIIPYLFGASSVVSEPFLRTRKIELPFEQIAQDAWCLPYATSLRMSDIGYSNQTQLTHPISYNGLEDYLHDLKRLLHTPSPLFSQLSPQINANILQTENELYAPIRPKRVIQSGESSSEALLRNGVAYVEVRALDVNPWSPIGIDIQQIYFLDLFLIWCVLADSPLMSQQELYRCQQNWNRISLAGRQPQQFIMLADGKQYTVTEIGNALFSDLQRIAVYLDNFYKDNVPYQRTCAELAPAVNDPSQTLSARLIAAINNTTLRDFGLTLAEQHRHLLRTMPLKLLTEKMLFDEQQRSLHLQQRLEQSDVLTFEQYLTQKQTY